jgi:DHA1 family bicyclomycin/chloramphenicol resistance-like MFS transporter
VFPILTLAILDMYPQMRGTASSMQAFVGLLSNALIAGLLSPLLSDDPMHLALGATAFSAVAWVMWRWYLAHCDRWPEASANAASLAPTDEM